ncbi:oxidoreductase [Oceanobacillus arenosus]|uniref:Oxidoreductase n=1 Tax=Oceanobacillus arenosus TaxID=1229153 RepID=A0A3D8PZV0_9BACI|nr:iron-containing alcohol dehydrogenase family protein [Oceanobacillus arenosus]RDW21322.1 oxidoreductase [Oceanobacillus arenosus]
MKTISVHGAPSEYILQEGILNELEDKLIIRGFKKILIVHGEKSWQAAKPFWPAFNEIEIVDYTYHGECSITEIDAVAKQITEHGVDSVIGVGGGKVLDLVKSACHVTHIPYVLIPTLASNCSPWTPISVIYDDTGTFTRFDLYPENASLVLIEPQILLLAPIDMMIAGIADTLAKWYEADVQMANIKDKPAALELSHYTAKLCKDVLLQHAEEAINAAKNGTLNYEFTKVAEAIIMFGGIVGGFGDHYGRVAGAHSIHNGLTALEETHYALHGEKVAYGILVQLMLENKRQEIEQILPFYDKLGLPTTLKDLGVTNVTEESISLVAEKATISGESIHVLPGVMTSEVVTRAMMELEKYVFVK